MGGELDMKYWITFLLLLVVSCTKQEETVSFPELKDKNIVLLLIDTLRADHLSTYGYPKETAPFLRKVADQSVVFDNHISSCPSTAPATASIHTGLYMSQHGVLSNLNVFERLLKEGNNKITINKLPPNITTISTALKAAGYKTYGLADNINVSEQFGFETGFDKYAIFNFEGAEKINSVIKTWADEIKSSGKFFLYLHYIDPHQPYHKRSPWFQKASTKKQAKINAYDSEISYLDSHLEEVFKMFNILEDTILIVISDHGEEFYEHGFPSHGRHLYTESIHVPLFIHYPGIAPRRVSERTSHIDILPTVANLASLAKENSWVGISLAPALIGKQLPNRPIFSELYKRQESPLKTRRSVHNNNFHLIETDEKENNAHTYELFDTLKDYSEKHDLYKSNPTEAEKMKPLLKKIGSDKIDHNNQTVTFEVSSETVNQLKTLGYVD